MTIVIGVLLMLTLLRIARRVLAGVVFVVLLVSAGCSSESPEAAQLVSAAPTAVSTTTPLSVPTPTQTPTPQPGPTATPAPTPTPVPATPTSTPSAVEPTSAPTVEVAEPVATTETVEPAATPTPNPPATTEPQAQDDPAEPEPTDEAEVDPTPVPATPTAVVLATAEPPLECFDRDVRVYRAHVDGIDDLSFEGGRVYCSGAGTNAVSAAASYRHASGLVVSRNADFIFNEAGTAYIPYSGTLYFCVNGQPQNSPFRADTVPALLVVIDNEAQRLVVEGASAPAAFSAGGTQC